MTFFKMVKREAVVRGRGGVKGFSRLYDDDDDDGALGV